MGEAAESTKGRRCCTEEKVRRGKGDDEKRNVSCGCDRREAEQENGRTRNCEVLSRKTKKNIPKERKRRRVTQRERS